MSVADRYFIEETKDLLENGFSDENFKVRPKWEDGTPAHTIKTFCVSRRYDLSKEFPILTLRQQYWKTALRELIWMWIKKSNNIKDLPAKIWDSWASADGSLGETYGAQLRKVYDLPEGRMDQVDALIYNLKNNPMNRRMIVTMWNPADLTKMNLSPCCYETVWDVTDGKLNCCLIQRSGDSAAASGSGCFDTIEYAFLVHMLAQVCNLKPGILEHIIVNSHIYSRHIDIMKWAIQNPEYEAPKIWLNPEIKNFYDFTEDDIKLIDYKATKYEGKIEVAV